jgi:Domain of unknown function (DUF4833)
MKSRFLILALLVALPAEARDFTSNVTESADVAQLRPEFKIPDEPNQLFYVQRSPNSNTVVYAARLDGQGNFDARAPVDAFWRKFNIDGSKQSLNFMERMMAYGVKVNPQKSGRPITFTIAALPERLLTLSMDAQHHPMATMQIGGRTVRVAYVYLQVMEGGLMPSVPSLDVLGTDLASGRCVHEHLIQK